jgi:hypothetical protein
VVQAMNGPERGPRSGVSLLRPRELYQVVVRSSAFTERRTICSLLAHHSPAMQAWLADQQAWLQVESHAAVRAGLNPL